MRNGSKLPASLALRILIVTLFYFCSAENVYSEDVLPFFAQNKQSEAIMLAALSRMANFANLACVDPASVEKVQALLSDTTSAMTGQTEESLSYETELSKPMDGTGSCDGGFLSVGREIHKRVIRTRKGIAAHEALKALAKDSAKKNLLDPTIDIDGTNDEACGNSGAGLYREMEADTGAIENQFSQLIKSLEMEEQRLGEYEEKNLALAKSCGSQAQLEEQIKAQEDAYSKIKPTRKLLPRHSSGDITGIKVDFEKRANGDNKIAKPIVVSDVTGREKSSLGKPKSPSGENDSELNRLPRIDSKSSAGASSISGRSNGVSGGPGSEGKDGTADELLSFSAPSGGSRLRPELRGVEPGKKEMEKFFGRDSNVEGGAQSIWVRDPASSNSSPIANSMVEREGSGKPSEGLASPDMNIFVLVHRAYRRSDLFR